MDRNQPANSRLISFAISMMLTSAFFSTAPEGIIPAAAGPLAPGQAIMNALNGLQASGWHGAADLTVPIPASVPASVASNKTTPPPSPITEAQLRKVLNILVKEGADVSLESRYGGPLGLSKNGERVPVRHINIEDGASVEYGFSLLKDGTGYILDKGPRGGNRIYLHLDANFKVVTAIAKRSTGEISALSPDDAEARLRDVLAIWAEYADQA